ncbi:MAG: hypothetical protein O2992_07960 [Gemmatimonadetes bacterium]|jgi:hypothetical protein|nr:hypothetical protein [Gemmatimonadota bacterium]
MRKVIPPLDPSRHHFARSAGEVVNFSPFDIVTSVLFIGGVIGVSLWA